MSIIILALCSLSFWGCNTTSVGITDYENAVPKAAFSEFKNFELKELSIAAPFGEEEINQKARAKLQAELDLKLSGVVDGWNQSADKRSSASGSLVIEPRIREIKYVSGSSRFWGGAMSGDSGVVVEVKYSSKNTGEVVSHAIFYQHANAMGGAWSVGGTDKAMLNRMGTLIMEFTMNNFDKAVGGPTGKPVPGKK